MLCQGMYPDFLTIGGVSFAADINGGLSVFKVNIENSKSNILTTLQILAPSEYEARDYLYLNGWKVIDIKKVNVDNETVNINLNADDVHSPMPERIVINSKPKDNIDSLLRSESSEDNSADGYPVLIDGSNPYKKKSVSKVFSL